ncbi:MAG: radical SAM protein [Bacteroidales bacterium]
MFPDRKHMYNFPWTRSDNPGAWIEVTDICNLACPGCFRRNNFEGHRTLAEIKKEILQCREMTNCSRISISGGEPLLYPDIIEVVKFITSLKLKCIILSNGELLTPDFIAKLSEAGLFQFFLHVDSGQNRPGWTNKTEAEMNNLRQYYVDMVHDTGKIKCGFNMTIRHSNLNEVPDIVRWYRANIDRVSHLSCIAFRGIPKDVANVMCFNGQKIILDSLPDAIKPDEEIDISSTDILEKLSSDLDYVYPSAYLKGTTRPETFKLITINNIGSRKQIYGAIGEKTMKMYQDLYYKLHHKYDATVPGFGKMVFLMAFFDKEIRKAFRNYSRAVIKNPSRLFEKIFVQSLVIQQPFEVIDGELNLCDGCINLMPYKGEMINSCRLDEYRLLGGPIKYSQETIRQPSQQ